MSFRKVDHTLFFSRHHHQRTYTRVPQLPAEEEVEVAKADISVDGDHKKAQAGEGEADVGGLVHVALTGGNDNDARDGAGELGWACGSTGGGRWGVWGLGFWRGGDGNGGGGEERA
ncbi:hypothetical protein GYH30_010214 [Glycine max]|nr:hypothetical protein GYH30_010214 [Glycine max]